MLKEKLWKPEKGRLKVGSNPDVASHRSQFYFYLSQPAIEIVAGYGVIRREWVLCKVACKSFLSGVPAQGKYTLPFTCEAYCCLRKGQVSCPPLPALSLPSTLLSTSSHHLSIASFTSFRSHHMQAFFASFLSQVVASCWALGLRAELLPRLAPTLTEQFAFAAARGMKWLVVLDSVKLSGPDGPIAKVRGGQGWTEEGESD